MKDWGRKRVVLLRTLAALTGAGVFLFASPSLSPLLEALLGRATLFSAALAMPGGALETVRQRCRFSAWYLGHYHREMALEQKYFPRWERISEIG